MRLGKLAETTGPGPVTTGRRASVHSTITPSVPSEPIISAQRS